MEKDDLMMQAWPLPSLSFLSDGGDITLFLRSLDASRKPCPDGV